MEKPDLLTCPFCGGKAEAFASQRRYNFMTAVECTSCGANTGPVGLKFVEAAEKWNRRGTCQPANSGLPAGNTNTEKLDDVTLAILSLSILENDHPSHPGIQVDPKFDSLTLERLHAKGFLATEPHPPVNVIWLTPEGEHRARELFKKYFGK